MFSLVNIFRIRTGVITTYGRSTAISATWFFSVLFNSLLLSLGWTERLAFNEWNIAMWWDFTVRIGYEKYAVFGFGSLVLLTICTCLSVESEHCCVRKPCWHHQWLLPQLAVTRGCLQPSECVSPVVTLGVSYLPGKMEMGFPQWLSIKESVCNVGATSLIPGLGRSPGEGNDNLL